MLEPPDADVAPTATMFPVILYDGEREINVGNINIHPNLVFKQFQMMLSQMIGISYNNLTTYLVDTTKPKVSPDRRRILITGKVNFAGIVRETNCCFLVVLKRSRRDRRKQQLQLQQPPQQQQQRHVVVKQSDYLDLSRISYNNNNYYDFIHLNDAANYYDERFHDVLDQREDYINMIMNSYGFDSSLNPNFPRVEDAYPKVQNSLNGSNNRFVCEECLVAEKQGKRAEFHLCVNDEVVVGGFRSPVGPVSRPVERGFQ